MVLKVTQKHAVIMSLTSAEIIQSYSASPSYNGMKKPFALSFFLWDNDILHVITFFFVFLGEIVNGLLNRSERHWSKNNHRRRYAKTKVKRQLHGMVRIVSIEQSFVPENSLRR